MKALPWGSVIFWYTKNAEGYQILNKPNGEKKVCKEECPLENLDSYDIAGWQRAMLFMEEYCIWDATNFACSMDSLIYVATQEYDSIGQIGYVFGSWSSAKKGMFPFLSQDDIDTLREYERRFYKDPNLQTGWASKILYPYCLKFHKDLKDFTPIYIGEIGISESQMYVENVEYGSSLKEDQTLFLWESSDS